MSTHSLLSAMRRLRQSEIHHHARTLLGALASDSLRHLATVNLGGTVGGNGGKESTGATTRDNMNKLMMACQRGEVPPWWRLEAVG